MENAILMWPQRLAARVLVAELSQMPAAVVVVVELVEMPAAVVAVVDQSALVAEAQEVVPLWRSNRPSAGPAQY